MYIDGKDINETLDREDALIAQNVSLDFFFLLLLIN